MCVDRSLGRAFGRMIWTGYCYDAIMAIHLTSAGTRLAQEDPGRWRLLPRLIEFFNHLSHEAAGAGYAPVRADLKFMSPDVAQLGRNAFYRAAALVRPAQAEGAVAKEIRDLLQALLDGQPLSSEQQAFGLEIFGQLQLDIREPYIAML